MSESQQERRTVLVPVRVEYLCHKCGEPVCNDGERDRWGKFHHYCFKCNESLSLDKSYPYVEYQEAKGER